jgi:hypothetical protein
VNDVDAFLARVLHPLVKMTENVLSEAAVLDESCLFPSWMVACIVASDDALHLPPAQVEEKLTTAESYLAHEQLVKFVGGC